MFANSPRLSLLAPARSSSRPLASAVEPKVEKKPRRHRGRGPRRTRGARAGAGAGRWPRSGGSRAAGADVAGS